MCMSLAKSALVALGGAFLWANFPAHLFMASKTGMNLDWLKGAKLTKLPSEEAFDVTRSLSSIQRGTRKWRVQASTLWQEKGMVLMAVRRPG